RSSSRVLIDNGQPMGVTGVISDITEQKLAEAQLRESEEIYRLHFEHVPDVIYSIDPQLRLQSISPSVKRILGFDPEEMIGKPFAELGVVAAESMEKAFSSASRVLSGETVESILLEFVTVDGSRKFGEVSSSPLVRNGVVVAAVCVARDITERRKAEEAFRESEAKYAAVVKQARDGIVIVQDGVYKFANDAWSKICGYSLDEIIGMPFLEVLLPRSRDLVANRGKKRLAGKNPRSSYEVGIQSKDGTTKRLGVSAGIIQYEGKPADMAILRDITERKQAEKDSRESEERYRTLFESSNDAVMLLDENGFFDCNQATLNIFQVANKATFATLHPSDVSPPTQPDGSDSTAAANERIAEAFKKGSNRFEWVHRRENGEDFYAEVLLTAFPLRERKVLQATVRDVTARKLAEETIRRRLTFEETVAAISSRFVSPSDIDEAINLSLGDIGKLSGASRAYLFLLRAGGATMDNLHEWCSRGVSPQIDNLQGLSSGVFPWWMKELSEGEIIHIRDVSRMPEQAKAEKEILENQGVKSVLVLPVIMGTELAGFIGFDDISETGAWSETDLAVLRMASEVIGNALERKRTEGQILQRNRELSALNAIAQTVSQSIDIEEILNSALDDIMAMLNISYTGVYILDDMAEYLVLWIHKGISDEMAELVPPMKVGEGILGKAAEAGDQIFVELSSESPDMEDDNIERISVENQLRSVMFIPLKAKGRILGVMFACTQGDRIFVKAERELLITVGHQVSTAIENAQLLGDASRALALEETDRLRSAFLASVSHEMRTPMTSIKGIASSLVQTDIEWDAETQTDFLLTIDKQSDRLLRIIDDVLDMSKIEAGAMKLLKTVTNLDRIVTQLSSKIDVLTAHHHFELRLPKGLPPILADDVRMGQVITNLVENAATYSAKGSQIILEAKISDDGELLVSVSDQGEGIPPDRLEKVFSHFYRLEENTERRTSGSGLALAISRGIIESHGGKIWAESEGEGKGTTIYFTIPIYKS
ncbi:MAG: PAS domain S-box protein, partial [Chloroflexi bacterium]|nr:PAS domain S-box protein [Chloroflexota bacterium]